MGDASYPEDDDRGRLVSIIHEALKKIEGARHGYAGAHTGKAAAVKLPQRKTTMTLVVVTVFVVVAAAVYTIWSEKTSSVQAPSKTPVQGVDTRPGQSPEAAAKQPAASAVTTGSQAQVWSDAKGIEFFNLGRYSEAAAEFAEGVRREPENSVYLNNLGLAYFRMEKIAEAEEAYKKALAINPVYPEALNNYGGLLASKGDHAGAIKNHKAAISLRPDYAEAHLNSAIAHELAGDLKTALEGYERFLSLADGAKDAQVIAEVRKKLLRLRQALIVEDVKDTRR